jgi:hypothetical protein
MSRTNGFRSRQRTKGVEQPYAAGSCGAAANAPSEPTGLLLFRAACYPRADD